MADDGGDDQTPNPFEMFGGMPMFGDISRMLAGQGPLNWDAARQFAIMSATGGSGIPGASGVPATASPNIDPSVRIKYAELANIARLHVADVMGLDVPEVEPSVATPEQWAAETLEAYKPLFTEMATSLGPQDDDDDDDAGSDPMMQMMAGLSKMMAPAMLGMAVGSMVGNLAARAFGVYDLPIPRATPALVLVPPTIDAFAAEWEISLDEMRLWVLAHELAGLALFSIPHVADHLRWSRAASRGCLPSRRVGGHGQADVARHGSGRSDGCDATCLRRSGSAARCGSLRRAVGDGADPRRRSRHRRSE